MQHSQAASSKDRTPPDVRLLVIALGFVALLFSIAALMYLDLEDHGVALNLAAIGTTCVLAAVFASEYGRDGNALSPIAVSSVMLFLLFPLHAWLTQDSLTLTMLIGSDTDLWRTRALLIASLSAPCLLIGYRSRWPARIARRFRSPGWVLDDFAPVTRSKMFIVYFVGFLPRLIALAAGQGFHWENPDQQLQSLQFLLSILGNLPVLACTWFIVIGIRGKRRDLLLIGLTMFSLEAVWSLLSGSRMKVIAPVMVIAVALGHTVMKVRVRHVAILLTAFVLVFLPFVTAFKTSYFERIESIQREGVGASTIMDSLSDASSSDLSLAKGEGPLSLLAERFHGATSLALVVRYTPERHDYYYGIPYLLAIPQLLIPRVIWPDKPAMNPFGDVFRYSYWGRDRSDNTSIGISQLGDLWVNLHLVGCLLGSMFYGAMMAFVARQLRYGLQPGALYPTIVFALHMPMMMHAHENSFDGILAGLPKSLFVYFVLAWLLSSRPSPPEPRAN